MSNPGCGLGNPPWKRKYYKLMLHDQGGESWGEEWEGVASRGAVV